MNGKASKNNSTNPTEKSVAEFFQNNFLKNLFEYVISLEDFKFTEMMTNFEAKSEGDAFKNLVKLLKANNVNVPLPWLI